MCSSRGVHQNLGNLVDFTSSTLDLTSKYVDFTNISWDVKILTLGTTRNTCDEQAGSENPWVLCQSDSCACLLVNWLGSKPNGV
jgi:hypothetical protein